MSRKPIWRLAEVRVISVTPAAQGLALPVLATVVTAAIVELGVSKVHFLHSLHLVLLAIFVVPCLLVVATRAWRWRSHKVHVTNLRIIAEGGILRHYRSEVDLRDVTASHVDQRMSERITRKGVVTLETRAGTMSLGLVHQPRALVRIIDQERFALQDDDLDYDTVFDFDETDSHDYEIKPRRQREGWRPGEFHYRN